jgi:hypothetical protein
MFERAVAIRLLLTYDIDMPMLHRMRHVRGLNQAELSNSDNTMNQGTKKSESISVKTGCSVPGLKTLYVLLNDDCRLPVHILLRLIRSNLLILHVECSVPSLFADGLEVLIENVGSHHGVYEQRAEPQTLSPCGIDRTAKILEARKHEKLPRDVYRALFCQTLALVRVIDCRIFNCESEVGHTWVSN